MPDQVLREGSGEAKPTRHKATLNTSEIAPMSIDVKTAARVAHLARINVEDDALPKLADELSAILGFMEQLNEVDVDGVEPMTSVTPMAAPQREDVVNDGGIPERILANAPDAREGFFSVPKVVE